MLQKIFKKGKGDIVIISEEKINEINGLLREGYSLNKLDKENKLGCSRRAFCNNAKKLGYSFNKEENKFIFLGKREVVEAAVKDTATKKPKEKKEVKEPKSSLTLEQLDLRLKKLEELVLQGNTPVTLDSFKLDKSVVSGEIKPRTFKVNECILKDFDSLCNNELAAFSKSNIISQALKEFIDKYSKKEDQ